jgi:outer membrane protein TolC
MVFLISFGAQALTLDEASRTAEASSHELKISSLEARESELEAQKSFAGFLPKVDLTGRHIFNERFEELELEFGGSNVVIPAIQPYSALGVHARLDVFSGFKTVNGLRAARAGRSAAELKLERMRQSLRTEVRSLFYKALGTQMLIAVADQNVKTLAEHLDDVNARVRSGVSTRFDVLRIEVQLEEARTEKTAAEDAAMVARSRLFEKIAATDDGRPLSGNLPEDWSGLDLGDLQAKRADREAQVLSVEREHDLARAAKAHWLPELSLYGTQEWYNNYNHALTQDDERFKSAYQYGLMLSWNLFDGGASLASQRQAVVAEREEAEKLAALDRAIPADIDEARRRLLHDISTYKAKLSSIHKAEESVRLAKSGLRAGIRTNTEVLDAVVDMNRAKATAVRAQIDAVEALGTLELAVGRPLLALK